MPSSALPVGRGHADLAEGAGQYLDPVLVRYYATLELPYGTGLDRVSRTWRRLVKKSNPDLYSADEDKEGYRDGPRSRSESCIRRTCQTLGT